MDTIMNIIEREPYIQVLITFGVIALIGTFLFYRWLVYGMNKVKKKLGELSSQENVESRIELMENWFDKQVKFIPKALKQSWEKFYSEYRSDPSYIPDVYESFKEDQIVYKAGYRKFVETIPAIFVSLGILGTFVGITIGISEMNSDATASELQGDINTLLSGMEFAFYSSIVGIVISLAYQIIDRTYFYRLLSSNFEKLLNELDKQFPIKTEGSLLEEIVNSQHKQMDDLKTFFSGEFISQLTSGISETISSSLDPHLEKSNQIMDKVAQNTMDAQSEKLDEMVNYFIKSLNEVTGDHMKDLGQALKQTVEWQEKVHNEMSSLVEELSSVAEKQAEMAKNTTELSEQMNTYTETLSDYQGKLVDSTQELNSITEQNTNLLEEIRALSTDMIDRQQETDDNFMENINKLNSTVDQISNLGNVMTTLQDDIQLTSKELSSANQSLNENVKNNMKLSEELVKQHEVSNQWSEKTQELIEGVMNHTEINDNIQSNVYELFEKVTSEREKLDSIKGEQMQFLQQNTQDLKTYWNQNKQALLNNKEQFENLNNELSQSMNEFADHMYRGVRQTFEQFDKELESAVNYLAKGVDGISSLIEPMEQNINSISEQISRFNQSLEEIAATSSVE